MNEYNVGNATIIVLSVLESFGIPGNEETIAATFNWNIRL